MAYTEIYSREVKIDENGKEWYYINHSTAYDLSTWTKEEAEKNFLSWEGYCDRVQAECEAWGFYD